MSCNTGSAHPNKSKSQALVDSYIGKWRHHTPIMFYLVFYVLFVSLILGFEDSLM
jgi:hypothetical protein